MKITGKRAMALALTIVISLVTCYISPSQRVDAATEYITVEDFASSLATELGLSATEGSSSSGYVNALLHVNIIKEGEIQNYKNFLTRGDAMVFLNRADEYLYGDTLDVDLIKQAMEERITDIANIRESKREDVAKAYLKGYMKGYSDGAYSTSRTMKVKSKLTKAGALGCIKMLKNESLRAQISPDGQLIRTTNLPNYAKYYPYILASFPNTYYDWKFDYEGKYWYNPADGIKHSYENIKEYAAPVDIEKTTDFDDMKLVREVYLSVWVGKVRTYMERVFSADYRTIDTDWIEKVLATDYLYYDSFGKESSRKKLNAYVVAMKNNKTIVEYSKIAVDGSTLYYFNNRYYLRTYVKYRIVSSNIKFGVDTDTLLADWPYNDILYCNDLVSLSNFTIGKWREGHYDVALSWINHKTGENIGITMAFLTDGYYSYRRTDK